MYKPRLEKLQKLVAKTKLGGFLVTDKTNIAYLSGFTGSNGVILITRTRTILLTDPRYIERAKSAVPKLIDVRNIKEQWQETLKTLRIKSIGFEGDSITVNQLKKYKHLSPKIKFKDISGQIESMRAIKEPNEIKLIKKSQQINKRTFEMIKKVIQQHRQRQQRRQNKNSLREIDIAWEIKRIGFELGAEDVSFEPIVAFGKNTSIPHHKSGTTRLKPNDIILIDMGMKYKGYCSDMTRTILPKHPTSLQKHIYTLVEKAQKNALQKAKPGLGEQEIDSLARNIIEEAGYGENFVHGTGHGVGLQIHESPSLNPKGKFPTKPGMVMTIEPGIYLPGKFGVRIEDIVVFQPPLD